MRKAVYAAGALVVLGASAAVVFSTEACMHSSKTAVVEWDEKQCEGTEKGNACLSLRFFVPHKIRGGAPGDLNGILHWGLYKGGDVGMLGPGDNKAVREGETKQPLNLAPNQSEHYVHIPNLPPGEYQSLGYLDDDGKDEDSSGDPVTFPSKAFSAKADEQTLHDVPLDYLR